MQHYQSRRTFDYRGNKQRFQINHAKSKVNTLPEQPEAPEQARKLMLEVMGQPIRSKGELFSANDLHKIAGGVEAKTPSKWLENKQTQDLIDAICGRGIPLPLIYETHQRGKYQGVWLCENLMYAYAMWLSPEFHLLVIECFKQYAQLMITRQRLKGECKELTDSLMLTRAEEGKETKFFHYANEHRMIDRVLLSMPLDRYCKIHDIPEGKIRDYLTPEQLKRLDKLQSADAAFINLGYSYAERETELIKLNDRLAAREHPRLE